MAGTVALQTVLKTVQVLEAITQQESETVSLSRVSELLGWGRAATHQYLSSLVRAGWLQQDGDRQYQLATRAAVFGKFAVEHAALPLSIPRVMQELVSELNEAVSFAVMQLNEAVIVERYEPRRPFGINRDVERHMPLLETASGQVLLAFEATQTHTLGAETKKVVSKIRASGYAHARVEWMGDMIDAIAVPIVRNTQCIGALSVIAPEGRMDIHSATLALIQARERIESELMAGAAPLTS
jgi:DNA-binding IclR family transcriptional regulator